MKELKATTSGMQLLVGILSEERWQVCCITVL